METNKNVMPEFDFFPRLTRVARVVHLVFDHLRHEGLSEHNRGGAPALDRALYEPGYTPDKPLL